MAAKDEPRQARGLPEANGRATRCGALDGELRRYQAFSRPFAPHAHDAYVIGAVRAGRRALTCNGEDLALGPGDLLVLNPGDVHGCTQEGAEPLAYDSAALGRGLVEELTGTRDVRLRGPVLHGEELGRLADEALNALEAGDEALAEEALCLLLGALRDDAEDGAPARGAEPGTPDGLDEAAAYLRCHLADVVRLADLAAQAGMSRYQLVRAWRRRFGLTPMQALASQRVEHARALLAAGAAPAEAAQASGFSDQAHLTRAFRDRLGLTPAAYRRAVREEGAVEPAHPAKGGEARRAGVPRRPSRTPREGDR